MARKILLVSDDPALSKLWAATLEHAGLETQQATLSEAQSKLEDGQRLPAAEVLKGFANTPSELAGILLHDPSKPAGDPNLQVFFEVWQQEGQKLEDFESLAKDDARKERAMNIVRSLLPNFTEEQLEGYLQTLIDFHKARKDASEGLALTHPPSLKGVELLKSLRAEGSPFKDTLVVADLVYFDRQAELLQAGATVVNTSASQRRGTNMLVEELQKRGLAPGKPGGGALATGPKQSHIDPPAPPDEDKTPGRP